VGAQLIEGDTMATPITNYQPYVTMTQAVSLFGVFPSQNLGSEFVATLLTFAGNFAPSGYEPAQGQLLPIFNNEALFALIGTTYGGDGQTTFALPNLAGVTLEGTGQGPGTSNAFLGQTSGSANVNLPLTSLPASLGGSGVPISNAEPTIALTYGIAVQGIFPSQNFTPGTEASSFEPFLGEVEPFLTSFVPRGWLPCEGQLLSIAQNQALFSILGTTYGGNGTTNFALPDLRGRTPVGVGGDLGLQLGQTTGAETHVITAGEAPNPLTGVPGTPINDVQPSLALNYIIALQGVFPPRNFTPGTSSATDPAIGEVQLFAGNFAPRGWAFCNGQVLSIAQNTALFSLLGTNYGGNGTTNFALPDLRGKSILGAGISTNGSVFDVGQSGGEVAHTLIAAELPNVAPLFTTPSTATKTDGSVTVNTPNANDINIPVQTLTYTITGGEDSALFQLDANHNLTFKNVLDISSLNALPAQGATAGYQVNIQASDGVGGTATQLITVNVSPQAHQIGNTVDYSDAIGGVYVDLPTFVGKRAGAGGNWDGGPLSLTAIASDNLGATANIVGSAFNDLLVGDNAANVISGGAGTDVLFGQGGDDILVGGTSAPSSYNQLWGGTGNDTASYAGETQDVTADLAGLYGYVGGVAPANLRDTFNSIENLIGGSGNDALRGDSNVNILNGGAGNDILMGMDGDDTLIGGGVSGGGYNQLWGGNGNDTASYAAETTSVNASLTGLWGHSK
jgi:microcystin-dependent protein